MALVETRRSGGICSFVRLNIGPAIDLRAICLAKVEQHDSDPPSNSIHLRRRLR